MIFKMTPFDALTHEMGEPVFSGDVHPARPIDAVRSIEGWELARIDSVDHMKGASIWRVGGTLIRCEPALPQSGRSVSARTSKAANE